MEGLGHRPALDRLPRLAEDVADGRRRARAAVVQGDVHLADGRAVLGVGPGDAGDADADVSA